MGVFNLIDKMVDYRFWHYGLSKKIHEIDNLRIEYWSSESDKPALLLIHAFGADCKYSWFRQIRLLSKKYRLIIPNLLYFGASDRNPKSYKMENQVEAISKLLQALKIKEITIGGASYGAVVGCELANSGLFRVTKLFLSNSPLKFSLQSDWGDVIKDFGVDKKSEVLIPTNHKNLHALYALSTTRYSVFPSFVFRAIYKKLYLPYAEERRRLIDHFVEEYDTLAKNEYDFDFPILILWGEKDPLNPVRIAHQLQTYFGNNADLILLKKAAHLPNFDRPKDYNRALKKFLNS